MNGDQSGKLSRSVIDAVENQLRENKPPEVNQTLERLVAEGHSREEAITLIGRAMAVEIQEVMITGVAYNEERYLGSLKALPDPPEPE